MCTIACRARVEVESPHYIDFITEQLAFLHVASSAASIAAGASAHKRPGEGDDVDALHEAVEEAHDNGDNTEDGEEDEVTGVKAQASDEDEEKSTSCKREIENDVALKRGNVGNVEDDDEETKEDNEGANDDVGEAGPCNHVHTDKGDKAAAQNVDDVEDNLDTVGSVLHCCCFSGSLALAAATGKVVESGI